MIWFWLISWLSPGSIYFVYHFCLGFIFPIFFVWSIPTVLLTELITAWLYEIVWHFLHVEILFTSLKLCFISSLFVFMILIFFILFRSLKFAHLLTIKLTSILHFILKACSLFHWTNQSFFEHIFIDFCFAGIIFQEYSVY